MQVFIRTDASIQIGSGHVMRCLTLAKQLLKKNVNVKFICRSLEGNMIEYITQQGFEVYTLSVIDAISHWNWTKVHLLEDAKETISIIQNDLKVVDMLIVDHYSIDTQWEQQLRPLVKKIMVIDDIADRKHDCDLLLDQNYYLDMESRYKNLVPEDCIQFLGPNYALLRDEFFDINPTEIDRDGSINNILIFFGGSDSSGETIKALYAIEVFLKSNIVFNVVIGSANPFKEQIMQFCNQYENVYLHNNIDYMAQLMVNADLVIGAGGTASWERIYLKLASIVVAVADNQIELTKALAQTGGIIYLGEKQNVTHLDIQLQLQLLINNPEIVREMTEKCRCVMDLQVVNENNLISQILEYMKCR